jgi:hypothetical protein
MTQSMKEKLRTQKWELWLEGGLLSFLNGNFFSRVSRMEAAIDDIPEYENSYAALEAGLKFGEVYKFNNALHKVGGDMAMALLLRFAEATEATLGTTQDADIYLVDPYGRHSKATGEMPILYAGIEGAIIIAIGKDADISVLSDNIAGVLSIPTTGTVDIHGSELITEVDIPNASAFVGDSNPALTSINAPEAISIECPACPALTTLIATKAKTINASGCALTAKSIEDIFIAALDDIDNPGAIQVDMGTNALYSELSQEGQDACDALLAAGWAITISDTI